MSKIPILFAIIFWPLSLSKAQDLTVSKDSIKVYNLSVSSFADEVIFTSHSSEPIHLDSAFVLIAEMDTVGFSWAFQQKLMQVQWKGNYSSTQRYLWKMDSVGPDKYKLIKQEFRPPTDTPLSFSGIGTTGRISLLEIGFCFICDRTPAYPKYFKGTLRLFFSNGQVVELKLWSQDLRTAVRKWKLSVPSTVNRKPSTFFCSYRYLANGRRILASDKMPVRKNTTNSIRIIKIEADGRTICTKVGLF
jgi:hypothetical protein